MWLLSAWLSPAYYLCFALVTLKAIPRPSKYEMAIPSTQHNEPKYKEGMWAVVKKSD